LVHISGVIARAKYYGAWKFSELVGIISGMGFHVDPETKLINFNLLANINILNIEFGENIKMLTDNWNIYTAIWLRRYVYDRVEINSLKLTAAFFASAFWHGFYRIYILILAGYYMSFLCCVPLNQLARSCRTYLRPLFIKEGPFNRFKIVYDIMGTFLSIFLLEYFFLPFMIHSWEGSIEAWKSFNFAGHYLVLGSLFLLKYAGVGHFFKRFIKKKQ
jgi:lysophospholipid acyltransferase